ncbi:MAG: glycosyltransferase [Nitrospirae bacterium]|nr:glycosyltransferase [Nitrospirota bacterium]
MRKTQASDIKLVITVALKKEIPKDWLVSRQISVHTIAALRSGAFNQQDSINAGFLVVITGAGYKGSEEAAFWIRDNLNPLFVINIGTCGFTNKKYPIGEWISPRYIANEEDDRLELDTRLPIPSPGKITDVHSLISVKKTSIGNITEALKKHDAIDMECYPQAKIFHDAQISFHCLKCGTDYSGSNTLSDFNRNIELFTEDIKNLFSFAGIYNDRPRVTVIVPVYNRQQTVRRAIDSVLFQSYMPEKIVVVNDGSTDGTQEILKSYGDKLTLVSLPENSGPSRARNEGIQYAKTDWVAFLDSDDSWEKNKLKDQVEYLRRHPFYQILQSEEIWIRNGVRVNPCKHHAKPEGWIWEPSLERCLVSPSGVLVKKSLLEKYGLFDEGLPVCEDYDLWLKISRHHPVGLEPSFSVIKYGGHESQLSRKYPAMDRFRMKSLVRLLGNEPHPDFKKKIINVLAKKLKILIKGFEKRESREEAEECRVILNSL